MLKLFVHNFNLYRSYFPKMLPIAGLKEYLGNVAMWFT